MTSSPSHPKASQADWSDPDPIDPNGPSDPNAGIFGLSIPPDRAEVIVVPVPFDATASYRQGAADAPSALLKASHQIDLLDSVAGEPYRKGIAMLDHPAQVERWNRKARSLAAPIHKAGGAGMNDHALHHNLEQVNALCEELNDYVYHNVKKWLAAGRLVATLGGDHATPFGAIRAHAERSPGMAILHIDAHADCRRAYEGFVWSHASIMANVCERIPEVSAIIQVGVRDYCQEEEEFIAGSGGRIRTHLDTDLSFRRYRGEPWFDLVNEIIDPLPEHVYISFDIDGLDPALCPHTGTPVPGGLQFNEALALLHALVESGRIVVGFDLCEIAPGPEGDEWDANVGARLLYKLIGLSIRSRGGKKGGGTG